VAAVVAVVVAGGARGRLIDVDYASHGPQVDAIVDELGASLGTITPVEGRVAFYSSVTGGRLETSALDADYWVTGLRNPVRFSAAIEAVLADGHRVLVESSPHPVLSLGMQETAEGLELPVATVPTLLRDQGGPAQLARSLGAAFAAGVSVDWKPWFTTDPDGPAPAVLDLPTYAFQHTHYWPTLARLKGDVSTAGMRPLRHGLLSAAVATADGGLILTGRLPARNRSGWLCDHEVAGTVLLPASMVTEWVLRAADEVGCSTVDELVLQGPVVLDETDPRRIQVTVGAPTGDGRREVRVYSSPEDDVADALDDWVCHATATIAVRSISPVGLTGQWPPAGAEPLDVTGCYERAAAAGFRYGPTFRGLRAAWSDGRNVFADVALPAEIADPTGDFGIHPVLLDAALHPLLLFGADGRPGSAGDPPDGQARLPFAWTGVSLHAVGASVVRVRLGVDDGADGTHEAGQRLRMTVADAVGTPVLSVDSVVMRPAGDGRSQPGAGDTRGLYVLDWVSRSASEADPDRSAPVNLDDWAVWGTEVPAEAAAVPAEHRYPDLDALLAAGAPVPPVVLTDLPLTGAAGDADAALDAARRTLDLARDWLARPALASTRLVLLGRGAVAYRDEPIRPDAAAAWGAIRALHGEHPQRFTLLDLDPEPGSTTDLARAVAFGEPELAVRAGDFLSPRLARAHPARTGTRDDPTEHRPEAEPAGAPDPDGTLLIVGGTGTLGGSIAEHLVRTGQARHVLLASRRGAAAPGASELVERLTEAGARVRVAAVDVTDPDAVRTLIAGIDPRHPPTGVIQAIGGPRGEADPAAGWARAAGAWNLHTATAELPLGRFAIFSSAAATLGDPTTPGDGAADAFCAAVVARRRADGRSGLSIGWGPWTAEDDPAGAGPGTGRAGRGGIRALAGRRMPLLFDAAAGPGSAHVVAAGIDIRALAARRADTLPPALRALAAVRTSARTAASVPPPADWAGQLAGLPATEQHRILLNLVRAQAAAVLGQSDPSRIEPKRGFLEIGIDSLTAVELRNRLGSATGLRLPPTLVFDHPDPDGLAGYLHTELAPREADALTPVLAEIDRLERSLPAFAHDDAARAKLAGRLRRMTAAVTGPDVTVPEDAAVADRIQVASADEILDFIDRNLGRNAAE
jgi:polyketide synthase 12